jgi:AraC-like DNA-binding protein
MGVLPTTLMSRFVRHGIPTPKRYLASARMVRAAHLLENPGCSITQAAFLMEYSSPQSFSRHLSGTLHIGAAEFRRRHTGESMLEMMRDQLVLPYLTQLREFDPFASPPAWLSRAPEPHAPEPHAATAISAPVHHHTAGNSAV